MNASRRATLSALLWTVVAAVFLQHVVGIVREYGVPIAGNDFPAFYCAGKTLIAHASPYALEPLRSCEHALPHGSDLPRAYVTPAPLPPYALALFALLAELPYKAAAWIASIALASCCIGLALTLARVTRFPSGGIGCALLLCAGLSSAVFGQLPPVLALAVALCGLALLRDDDAVAACCAAAATIEPHVGVPVALSLFIFRPGTRLWLAGAALVFATAGALAVTPLGALHYLTTVLPEHARAELLTVDQFSMSHVLALAGAPASYALSAGGVSYLVAVALGIAAGKIESRRLGDAAIAYFPAAGALLAGTFVHEIDFVAALPAALLCISRGRERIAWAGIAGVAAIATMPFTVALSGRLAIDTIALVCGVVAVTAAVRDDEAFHLTRIAGTCAIAAACVAFPLALERAALPQISVPASDAYHVTNADASQNWGAYLRSDPRYATPRLDAEASKLPIWLGLAVLLFAPLTSGLGDLGLKTQAVWDRRPRIRLSE